jgi:hypothetical protein
LSGANDFSQSYILRRKKEFLSLLVVRFLLAHDTFNGIYEDFQKYGPGTAEVNGQNRGSFFERIKDLDQSWLFEIEA